MRRTYNDTSHDADAVCEKLDLVGDCISEADMTLHGIQTQLSRIASALEKLAGIESVQTAGTMA